MTRKTSTAEVVNKGQHGGGVGFLNWSLIVFSMSDRFPLGSQVNLKTSDGLRSGWSRVAVPGPKSRAKKTAAPLPSGS